jgi:adenylate cyclase
MLKTLRYTLILFLTLYSVNSYAQKNNQIDSLLKRITNEHNKEQVDLLNKLSASYYRAENRETKDSAKYFSQKAINIAQKIGYKDGLAEAFYEIGKYYIGIEYKPALATNYLLKGLELFTVLKNKPGMAKCYMQLGLVSYLIQYYQTAIKNFKLSITAKDEPTSNYLLALTYIEVDSFLLAKKYFAKSISQFSKLNSPERVEECYLWLGRLYLKTGEIDSAFFYINKTITAAEIRNDNDRLARPYAFVSEAYLKSNNMDKAIYFGEKSLNLLDKRKNDQEDDISVIQASKVLSEGYATKTNYKKAHYYLSLYNETNNNYTQGNLKQKIGDMQSMFEFDKAMDLQKIRQKKDKEIAAQQIAKERVIRNALLAGALLLLLLLGGVYNSFNLKKRANTALQKLNEEITLEKKRSDDLLLNILPEEIAHELKENGEAAARDFQQVSILFTDFKEFTQASEKMSAKDLVAEINHCFKAFDGICQKYDIEKIKTIGDSYMAAGGLPMPNDASTKNLVLAAIEMAEFMTQRKKERLAENFLPFEMRAGIHTGNVVAGIVGVIKFQYDIWGDTVNTASRVESNGEVGKVNISGTTYELLKNDNAFAFERRGKVNVKGKGEIEMYFVSKSADRA